MTSMRIHPGPFNNELLFAETEHRAYTMFYGGENPEQVLDVRRGDLGLWQRIKQHGIPDPVMNYIRRAGFEGVFNCGFKPLDHALITALVERWRPETHTFHLPIGEVTITLQDVHLMWGLRIDGEVVTGCERKWTLDEKRNMCYRLLGNQPEPVHFKGAQLKMIFLRAMLDTPFPANPTNEQCMQRARSYILLLFGGSIFPDASDNSVHMNLLVLLEDFDRCGGLSWGSAALACLYRNLCKAATKDKIIAGPLMLLQLWAWSRIRATGPKYDGQNLNTPFGVRWNSSLHFESVPTHSVSGYRTILCAMMDDEFVWTPYDQYPHQVSPDWLCNTYIIFWKIVEECLPIRVMRQFHLMQIITTFRLSNPQEHIRLHHMTRRGTTTRNWSSDLGPQINHWMNRMDHYVNGQFTMHPTTENGYMNWYLQRTVIHIVRPTPNDENSYRYQNYGGTLQLAVEGLSQVYEGLRQVHENQPDDQHLHGLYETIGHYLGFTYGENRPHGYGQHVVPVADFAPVIANPVERVRRRWRVQRRRHDDEAGPSNRGEWAPSHHDDEAGPSNRGERVPSNFPVNRNNYVAPFDINLPWDENETEPVEQQDEDVQHRPS